MIKKVGFIGLGNIGLPMARNLLDGPFEVSVFDISANARESFAASSRASVEYPEKMAASCDVIGVCVRDDDDVVQVFSGVGGLLQAPRAGLVVAVHSTVRPATIALMAEKALEQGVHVIDAPITGGATGAEAKSLTYMVGGDASLVSDCRAVFETSARKIIHAGELGMGMVLKLCNNAMTYSGFIAIYESLRLARASGLEPAVLVELGKSNGVVTEQMQMFMGLVGAHEKLGDPAYQQLVRGFSAVAQKDLMVALELAEAVGESLPGCENSLALIDTVYRDAYRHRSE